MKVSAGAPCTSPGGSCPPPRCASSNPCEHVSGATVSSCIDTATGYEASCCFAARTLPPSIGSPNGGSDGPGTDPMADGGVGGRGGTDGGSTGGGGVDGGEPIDPGAPDGGKPMPPEERDGGTPPPPPPPEDGGKTMPPEEWDGAVPPPPPPPEDGGKTMPPEEWDGAVPPPPPPPDGGSSGGCELKPMPPTDELSPCSVSNFCPETGMDYAVRCLSDGGSCTCLTRGIPTGTVAASCAAFDPIAMLAGCGYPIP